MPKRLPGPDGLVVEREKILNYLLCDTHTDGSPKARFFHAFGFDSSDWWLLANALIQHGRTRDILEETATPFGMKYVVQCVLATPDDRNPCIRSVWIAERGGAPRLVTAYPAPP